MSEETRRTSTLLGGIASVVAILAFLAKGVWVAMEVHSDLNGARHDLNNALKQLERIEIKIDRHDEDIRSLKAKVGLAFDIHNNTVNGTR